MGWKTVTNARNYQGWKDWSKGDYLIGIYKESGEQTTKFGVQEWHDVEVIEASFDVPDNKLLFRFNGVGSMNSKMEEVSIGDKIKVIYDGWNVLSKGEYAGTNFHDVDVMVAEEEEIREVDLSGL